MTKYGIGVGEEFPVDEAHNPPLEREEEQRERKRRRHHHRFFHVLLRIGVIALIVSAIACLFSPHYFYPGPFVPYTYYPYPHHFPFFSVLLIAVLIAFAWRHGSCHSTRRHWHDEPRDDRREGA